MDEPEGRPFSGKFLIRIVEDFYFIKLSIYSGPSRRTQKYDHKPSMQFYLQSGPTL